MNFGDVLTQVYRVLEDPGQFAWPNSAVAFALQDAVRDVANRLGSADSRITLDLVQSQANYELPQGVRRINNLRILPPIPAGGSQAQAGPPLPQVDFAEFPVVSVQEGEPCLYTVSAVAGSNEDQFELMLHPTPDRSATDAIVVNVANEYAFTSDDPASAGDLAQLIPFPPQYDRAIIFKTAAGLLAERSDEADIRKGEYFMGKAEEMLRPMLPIKSPQSMIDLNRAFP